MKFLSEETKVTVSLVLALIGGVAWLTKINYTAEAAAKSLSRVLDKQEQYAENMADIRKDIAVIKHILEENKK